MKSAPKAMDRRLAPHRRKGDQTCEMKAKAWQKIAAHIHMWSKRFFDHMPTCYVCAWSSTSPSFSINIKTWAGRKHPSIRLSLKKKTQA
jgi:hypothetical protein